MKVLFCGLKNEYGKPEWGTSTIEYQNFFGTLTRMSNVQAEFFAIDEMIKSVGRDAMNQKLINIVEETRPDLLFCFLFSEELKKETIAYITRKTGTKTFNWFADDHWRFPIFSRNWAPFFTAVSTTDSKAVPKYQKLGVNIIKTQWAANTFLYKPARDANKNNYNITFVGKNYGNRGSYVKYLQNENLPAQGFGKGWNSGVVDFDKMLEIFSCSKINLNFTESPYITFSGRLKSLTKFFVKKELGNYKLNFQYPVSNFESFIGAQRRQIKGRTFEVPACGGFLVTGDADNLCDYYEDGKEIVIFKNRRDLVEKCQYYIEHEQERKLIAKAGYERTVREHTYENRFREIFQKVL